ncbi:MULTISPECIES: hypothetical protein [unclassified Roseateles]|uniref:hypothetical protein n=1 Tax=unclassified Roseateles TaxID=2626991 RepID=UPI0006FF0680|nr:MULTISPECIES: hypothetical protein [unclassified Roseateles]KQW45372.1 hypothetical protein ASC81_10630 [Pelomonas sp. Root405]KRA72216.1 hypothetical protein ASD88_10630 [Pelomonas sp. Root662]
MKVLTHTALANALLLALTAALAAGPASLERPVVKPGLAWRTLVAATWEDISTPAGSFRALRIEADGRVRNGCEADMLKQKFWFAPGIAVPLKQETVVYARGRIAADENHELQSLTRL